MKLFLIEKRHRKSFSVLGNIGKFYQNFPEDELEKEFQDLEYWSIKNLKPRKKEANENGEIPPHIKLNE